MTAHDRTPSPRPLLPAAVVALALAPGLALGDGTPALPRPGVRVVAGADAVASIVRESPGLAAGGRVSAGIQYLRLRLFGVLEAQGPLGTRSASARLDALVLGGVGLGYLVRDRALFHAALLGGREAIGVRDYLDGGWLAFGTDAGGARIGVSFRPVARGERLRIGPTVGLSLTALYVKPGADPLTGARWGGWAPMVTVSVGAEVRRSHVEPPSDGGSGEAR